MSQQAIFTQWQRPLSKRKIAQLQRAAPQDAWAIWAEHLSIRKRIIPLSKLLPNSKCPLKWSVDLSLQRDETIAFINQLTDKSPAKKNIESTVDLLRHWSVMDEPDILNSSDAMQCVSAAWTLPALSQLIGADLWWSIIDRLVTVAADTLQLDMKKQPLAANLLGGELPLALAYLFPELKSAAELGHSAIEFLSDAMVEMLDGEGMPEACFLPIFGPLLGCWTRCRAIMQQRKDFSWSPEAENQYLWLLTQAVRLSRNNGGFAFGPSDHLDSDRNLLLTAIKQFGNASDLKAAKKLLGRKVPKSKRANEISAAYHSEWATIGVLRSRFHRKSRQLCVAYGENQNRIELSQGSHILFSGDVRSRTMVDGAAEAFNQPKQWEEVAWESDENVDFLEIETSLNAKTKLQRSFLLSRNDHFLLLADTILCEQECGIQHQIQLPLGAGITVDTQEDTWELLLKAPDAVARILPVGLPEWKSGCRQGSLSVKRRVVNIEQSGQTRLFVPLFIDLSPKRSRSKLTWRQLSVGEKRENISSGIAAGFRVHIAKEQWLVYRSLDRVIPRTVLGQNLLCEYHVSRFMESGMTKPLIEVQ